MTFRICFRILTLTAALAMGSAGLASAADAPVALVNGVPIAARLMDLTVQANLARGQKDSPELRAALKQEFIARELLTQEAKKRGLDKLPATQDALLGLTQNLMIELVLKDEFTQNPITEAELKAEYERQVKVLKSGGEPQEFQVAVIVQQSEADARAIQSAIKSGQSFEQLAKTKSIDPSKDNGGDLGWRLPDQITPAISNVVVNLTPGTVSAAPKQVGPYWHVVKLVGKRVFQVPSFDASTNQLQAAVSQARRLALLKKLTAAATVK